MFTDSRQTTDILPTLTAHRHTDSRLYVGGVRCRLTCQTVTNAPEIIPVML